MSVHVNAIVIYSHDSFGEFYLSSTSALIDALNRFPFRGLPPDMPPYATYPYSCVRSVIKGASLADDKNAVFFDDVFRTEAEEAVSNGRAHWVGQKQAYILYEPENISWLELKEMPELLALLGEDAWTLNRITAIYEFMKVLALAAPDKKARFIYWMT